MKAQMFKESVTRFRRLFLFLFALFCCVGSAVGQDYLRFTAESNNSSIALQKYGNPAAISLQFRKNSEPWSGYTIGEVVSLALGETVEFQATTVNSTFSQGEDRYYYFQMEGRLAGSGPLGGLLKCRDQNSVEVAVPEYGFYKLFAHCDALTSAPTLPKGISANCYNSTFEYCTSLKSPAVGIHEWNAYNNYCFYAMYRGCSSLTSIIHYMPTQSPASYSCAYMFAECTSLTIVLDFPNVSLGTHCYDCMFDGCTGLLKAPALPATTLASYCYRYMFRNCTALEIAPALPATSLKDYCYYGMFYGCSALEAAPTLPAEKYQGAKQSYSYMFYDCSSLNSLIISLDNWQGGDNTLNWVSGVSPMGTFVGPNKLPQTVGVNYIPKGWIAQHDNGDASPNYFALQSDNWCNVSITKVENGVESNIPAGSVPILCYIETNGQGNREWQEINTYGTSIGNKKTYFKAANSTGTLNAKDVYYKIKIQGSNITASGNIMSLIDPTCQQTEVPDYAFAHLFEGQSSLKTAPELPFTTLGEGCYMNMFKGTGISVAPELPATDLAVSCYEGMFQECTALKAAPTLPATKMENRCYANMFNGCTSLNFMKVAFTAWTTNNDNCATKDWVKSVPQSVGGVVGTFIKPTSLAVAYGSSRIPKSNAEPWGDKVDMLCFTALTRNATVKLVKDGNPDALEHPIKWSYGTSEGTFNFTNSVTLANVGDKVFVYADGVNSKFSKDYWNHYRFEIGGQVEASGNVMSLLDPTCVQTEVPEVAFSCLFQNCAGLKKAPEFPAISVRRYGYECTFEGCTGLTSAPKLPATALYEHSYHGMFRGCSNLTYVPDLEAQIVSSSTYGEFGNACYFEMFKNCTSLVTAPALKSKTVTANCYERMFEGCSALVNAPELPAVISGSTGCNGCYSYMFLNCTSLKKAPELATPDLTGVWNAYYHMFEGCSHLEYINVGFPAWINDNTKGWTIGVPNQGIFVCDYELIKNGKEYGTDRIPLDPSNSQKQWSTIHDYLCFTAETGGSSVGLRKVGTPDNLTLEKSTDGGKTWSLYEMPDAKNASGEVIEMNAGDILYLRNVNTNGTLSSNASNYYKFVMEGSIKASGKVVSLLNVYCQSIEIPDYAFTHLFDGCVSLSTAPYMPTVAASLGEGCYSYMFKGCTRITTAHALPATTLAPSCYAYMYYGCTALTTAPELPATTLATNCYHSMFRGCKYLLNAPELPALTLADGCYTNMFYGCSRLKWMGIGFTDWREGSTDNWVYGVPKKGTFDCIGLTNLSYGPSRVPKNEDYPWTITYDGLCFTAVEPGVTVQLAMKTKVGDTNNPIDLQYSFNNIYWSDYSIGSVKTLEHAGDKIYFRSKSNALRNFSNSTETYYYFVFNNKKVAASGSATFLLKQDGVVPSVPAYAFCFLFNGCSSLVSAPSLPSTQVGTYSYCRMFAGCTSLVQAPVLPATTLGTACYLNMFNGCKALKNAPELPADLLAKNCYYGMFQGCTSLEVAPSLFPVKTASGCYNNMFNGCSSLNYLSVGFTSWTSKVNESDETEFEFTTDWVKGVAKQGIFSCPAELLAEFVEVNGDGTSNRIPYDKDNHWTIVNPFSLNAVAATNISLVPVGKPAEIELQYSLDGKNWRTYVIGSVKYLAADERIYFRAASSSPDNIFSTDQNNYYHFVMDGGRVEAGGNVVSLVDQSGSRTDLPNYAFANLFENCTALIAPPSLGSTKLSKYCYYNMFTGCSNLASAPHLRATDLDIYCYAGMFHGCTSLVEAPYLPATVLAPHCYESMFEDCSSLEFISVEFKQWKLEELEATTNWVKGVSTVGGYFMKPSALESAYDESHIPTNWNLSPQYLCFRAEEPGSTVALFAINRSGNSFEISRNGYTWTPYTLNQYETLSNIGDCIYFRNTSTAQNVKLSSKISQDKLPGTADDYSLVVDSKSNYYNFRMTGQLAGSGNIVSLLHKDCARTAPLAAYTFGALFYNCKSLIVAPNLPETNLLNSQSTYSYMSLFFGSGIRKSPALPEFVNSLGSVHKMFGNCVSLVEAPALPAMELGEECYSRLFDGCLNLEVAPELPATVMKRRCYHKMFHNCPKLKRAPELPAKELAKECYIQMFENTSAALSSAGMKAPVLNYIQVNFEDWGTTSETNYTNNWVNEWGKTETKGVFVCPEGLDSKAIGVSRVPKGWIVVNNKIGTLPDENNEIPAGYTIAKADTLTNAGLGLSEPVVLAFSANTSTLKTPHYVRVEAMEMECTTTNENAGTLTITGATEYYNSLSTKLGTGSVVASGMTPNRMTWKINAPEYGGSLDLTMSEGLYSIFTLYGKIKPHFFEPKMMVDYNTKKLSIDIPAGGPVGGQIYWSESSSLSIDNYLTKGSLYEGAIDLKPWMDKATGKSVESKTYYAISAPDNYDWKEDETNTVTVPSVVMKVTVYRWPMRCGYCVVNPGNVTDLKNALLYAQRTASPDYQVKIFVPEGIYDLGTTSCTMYGNVALIGESKEKTIIQSNVGTGLLRVRGASSYVQDLSIQNNHASGAAIRDYGTDNIYQNCDLTSMANAYRPDGDGLNRNYLDHCKLNVSTNYAVYGNGDVWFEKCTFDLGTSAVYVSGQTNALTNRYGHIFNDCKVVANYSANKTYYLSRPLSNSPAAAWIDIDVSEVVNGNKPIGYSSNSDDLALRYYGDDRMAVNWTTSILRKEAFFNVDQAFGAFADYDIPAWNPEPDVVQEGVSNVKLNNNNLIWESDAESGIFLIEATDSEGYTDYTIVNNKYFYIYDNMEGKTVKVRAANSRGGFGQSSIADRPATLIQPKLNASGYATFSYDRQVMIDGANAYIGKAVDDKIIFTRINPYDVVPANTGVFLVGSPDEVINVYEYADQVFSVAPGSNDWLPCLSQKTFVELESFHDCSSHDCCYYVLQGGNIVKRTTQGGGVLANRAYIHVASETTQSSPALRICFFDEETETGIESVREDAKSDLFDLNGRMTDNRKGLLIKAGKVILVK